MYEYVLQHSISTVQLHHIVRRSSEKMSEKSLTTSHLSVAMTTAEVTQIMTSSSSVSAEFYFECVVIIVGVVGTAANALVLHGMVASNQHRKHVLIVNQNALDLFSSSSLIVTYAVKLCNVRLAGLRGYWICVILLSDTPVWFGITAATGFYTGGSDFDLFPFIPVSFTLLFRPSFSSLRYLIQQEGPAIGRASIWFGITGSTINLASVTVERYLKVVHPVWSKKKLYLI